jgi:hypothetical protein
VELFATISLVVVGTQREYCRRVDDSGKNFGSLVLPLVDAAGDAFAQLADKLRRILRESL